MTHRARLVLTYRWSNQPLEWTTISKRLFQMGWANPASLEGCIILKKRPRQKTQTDPGLHYLTSGNYNNNNSGRFLTTRTTDEG